MCGLSSLQAANQKRESAETCGLPNARAAAALNKYCKAEATATNCTEATVRNHLRSLMDPRAEAQYMGQDLQPYYPVEIRFFMVIRVFLALDILNEAQDLNLESLPSQLGAR